MPKAYISLYYSYREQLEMLPDDERGRLIIALLDYAENGTIPTFDGASKMAFSFIRAQIDRDSGKYAARCQKNRENAIKRWNSENTNACNRIQPHANGCETCQGKGKEEGKEEGKGEGEREEEGKGECLAGASFDALCMRFSALVASAVLDWLAYKHERDEAYTPTGLQSLLEQIEKQIAGHGDQAVADVIRLSMSNGWRGIVWDKIRKEEARGQNTTAGTEDAHKLSGIIRL